MPFEMPDPDTILGYFKDPEKLRTFIEENEREIAEIRKQGQEILARAYQLKQSANPEEQNLGEALYGLATHQLNNALCPWESTIGEYKVLLKKFYGE